MGHANARTTVYGGRSLVERVLAGIAEVAKQLGVSRQTLYEWVRRLRTEAGRAWWIAVRGRAARA